MGLIPNYIGDVLCTCMVFRPSKEELNEILEEIDEDGSGEIEFGEFCQLCAKFLVGAHPCRAAETAIEQTEVPRGNVQASDGQGSMGRRLSAPDVEVNKDAFVNVARESYFLIRSVFSENGDFEQEVVTNFI